MSSDNHIPLDPRGGKGSKWRRMNYKKYRDNFDAIFGKKKKKKFKKTIDSPLNCNDMLCLQDRNSAVSILQNLNERKTLCIR